MVEQEFFENMDLFKTLHGLPVRTTIETAFYENNVSRVDSIAQAYDLAKKAPGTIELTAMPIYKPDEQGLPPGSNVLLFNDGNVVGRCAAARRIVGTPDANVPKLCGVLREAIFNARQRKFYEAEAVVGLDKDFMVRARLLIPEGFENNLLSWMLNFQFLDPVTRNVYKGSRVIEGEGEILVYADPYWSDPEFPLGLAFFSPEQNCAAILGMRYFGELKKGTLTLAWGAAARHGYAACHGGLKRFTREDGGRFVLGVFGLSGSGKSTITHARHGGKYDVTVLHDDAFIVNVKERYAIAMEPTYFDKLQDYPMGCEDNKYLLTVQNCGVTHNSDGKLMVVTGDLRNGNGRAVKSRLWTKNRVDRIDEPLNAICWLMKDPTLPPVVRLTGSSLASAMGATLATRRTTAEHLAKGVDRNALVIESYANPFRTYPLSQDYERFKALIDDGVACYILNTGDFMGKKILPQQTFSIIESIVEERAQFVPFGGIPGMEYMPLPGFEVDMTDAAYVVSLIHNMNDRYQFISSRADARGGIDALPQDALDSIHSVIEALDAIQKANLAQ
ncbi:MAG: phosphoenolpyruvate carboxykinase (ATP) [Pyramidobacter sp.]|nr:phosphoenolpyruvate carboxykinase (ATP) [Pyramidobacter sp.]